MKLKTKLLSAKKLRKEFPQITEANEANMRDGATYNVDTGAGIVRHPNDLAHIIANATKDEMRIAVVTWIDDNLGYLVIESK